MKRKAMSLPEGKKAMDIAHLLRDTIATYPHELLKLLCSNAPARRS